MRIKIENQVNIDKKNVAEIQEVKNNDKRETTLSVDRIIQDWEMILKDIKKDHNLLCVSFDTWLKPLKICDLVDNELVVIVPEQGYIKILEKKMYSSFLKDAIEKRYKIPIDIRFITNDYLEKITIAVNNKTSINSMYRFDNFVVCDGNMFAYLTAKEVATGNNRFNPFCIVGPDGNGKTHLLQAIGNAISETDPNKKVIYCTSESFINEFITSIKQGSSQKFRRKYRSVDVLLLDDIPFFAGMEGSEGEFAHLFDTLDRMNKQIVLSSDKAPRDIKEMDEHIRNFINSGLVIEISAPDKDMKENIIRTKAREAGIFLRDDVIDYIASNCNSNVSEIEGSIKSLVAYSELSKYMISLDAAKDVLKSIVSENNN
ncbi:chromosomal replication initiator protein [Oribacterium sp. KHPX15]|uniref:chromosomal replication initiator protein DnaA n=1 Tax=Oribacterium sp. KHPX15 TaxID=1855342 RepID=UPI000897B857|nr:chromosomal replication initiator protein DnaA [Oribacterium sp. KHPX15]SEA70203.1 chromosomal replication initiator protein [Oribacterium sp. KHPX15]